MRYRFISEDVLKVEHVLNAMVDVAAVSWGSDV